MKLDFYRLSKPQTVTVDPAQPRVRLSKLEVKCILFFWPFVTSETHQIVPILCSQYFLWRFPDDVDTVVVKAESENAKLCAIFSIQGTQVYCFCVIIFY